MAVVLVAFAEAALAAAAVAVVLVAFAEAALAAAAVAEAASPALAEVEVEVEAGACFLVFGAELGLV